MKKKLFSTLILSISFVVASMVLTRTARAATCSGPGDTSCGPGYSCVKYATSGLYVCKATNQNNSGNPPTNSNTSTTTTTSTSNSSPDIHGSCGDTAIDTAIGCVPVLAGNEEFISFILRWAIGIGGGIAFLLIVYAGFLIMTSSGNPERLKAGQELMTSAISGIVLLILSAFILNVIGVTILKIPGLK